MQKKIVRVERMFHGHLKLEFVDGTSTVLHRGTHLPRGPQGDAHVDDPKVGDVWPPAETPAAPMQEGEEQEGEA